MLLAKKLNLFSSTALHIRSGEKEFKGKIKKINVKALVAYLQV
jgi:hypothetical protein